MNLEFLIRKANHRDVEHLLDLLKDLFSKEADFTFHEVKQRRGLEMILDNDQSSCITVAELDGQVIGMCSAQILISTAVGGKAAMIEDVVVQENYRGCGVGRKLLSRALI
jgi:N-acetylglutamate synthase-like GNAT family acetyltransferase